MVVIAVSLQHKRLLHCCQRPAPSYFNYAVTSALLSPSSATIVVPCLSDLHLSEFHLLRFDTLCSVKFLLLLFINLLSVDFCSNYHSLVEPFPAVEGLSDVVSSLSLAKFSSFLCFVAASATAPYTVNRAAHVNCMSYEKSVI